MMHCKAAQRELLSLLRGELSEGRRRRLTAHLSTCRPCGIVQREFQAIWETGGALEFPTPPPEIRKSIQDAATAAVREARWKKRHFLRVPALALLLGLAATLLSAGIFSLRADLSMIPPLNLTIVGALWTTLYTFVFFLWLGEPSDQGPLPRQFSQISLAALGLFGVLSLLYPLDQSVHFCRYSSLTQPVFERLSIGGAFFVLGMVYAFIPMTLATYLSCGQTQRPLWKGALAGGLFVLLLLPGLYLKCAPFTFGILLGWSAGSLVGSVAGGSFGLWLRYQLQARTGG